MGIRDGIPELLFGGNPDALAANLGFGMYSRGKPHSYSIAAEEEEEEEEEEQATEEASRSPTTRRLLQRNNGSPTTRRLLRRMPADDQLQEPTMEEANR